MTAPEVQVRAMTSADIPNVCAIERAVFTDAWPDEAFHELLDEPTAVNLVLVDAQRSLLGYLCAHCVADEIQIHNIAVHPEFRRQGFGALLLKSAEDIGRQRGATVSILEVRATNEPAIALYERFGYRQSGRRRNYYRRPVCDALILSKVLGPPDGVARTTESSDGMVS